MRRKCLWATCAGLAVLCAAGLATAGALDPTLETAFARMGSEKYVSALVYLNEQADITGLTRQLDAQRAKLRVRHEAVVRRLQAQAESTQGGLRAHLDALAAQGEVASYRAFWVCNAFQVLGTPAAIRGLAEHPDVHTVYYDYGIELDAPISTGTGTKPDPLRAPTSGVQAVRAPEVWALGFTGEGVLVATLDTGVDGNHPALASRWRGVADPRYADHPEWAWFDPVTNTQFPTSFGAHGTHTMGTVCGGAPGQEVGVAPGAQWIHAAVIDRVSIAQTVADALLAFEWMIDPDGDPTTNWDVPAVCSNSWRVTTGHGYPPCDQTFWVALDNCEAAGIVQIFSAGNEGPAPQTVGRPPDRATDAYRTCAIGAINGNTPSWPIADFSSRGPSFCTPDGSQAIKPDLVAPGVNVYSSVPGGGYQDGWDGTSMASPHVNGAIALVRQACPDLTVEEVKQVLYETVVDLGPAGDDNAYGLGMIDAYEAVQIALSMCSGAPRARDVYQQTHVDAATTVTLNATDYDGLPDPPGMLTYLITTLPAHATLSDPGNGHELVPADLPYTLVNNGKDVLFAPAPGFYGNDTFLYKANDGGVPPDGGDSEEATVTVLVLYDPPVITTDALPLGRLNAWYAPFTLEAAEGQPDLVWDTVPVLGYVEIDLGQNQFVAGGTPQNWRADNAYWTYSLPFAFPFYGQTYTSVHVCSNGFLAFGTPDNNPANSDAGLISAKRIAPLWDNLRTDSSGGDIFIDTGTPGQVTIRWRGTLFGVPFQVNVACTLYADGRIRFHYGTGNVGLTPTIGISAGDGVNYSLSTYNGLATLTSANSHQFANSATLPAGLTLSAAGVVSGVPLQAGEFFPQIRVRDALNRTHVKVVPIAIEIGPYAPVAQDQNLTVAPNVPVLVNLVAQDDGLPNPPGLVTYTITALPQHGGLSVGGDAISSVPYTLPAAAVEYAPNPYYLGVDSFTFTADDGGVPPDGGVSNVGTITTNAVATASLLVSLPLDTNPGWTTEGLWAFGQPAGLGSHAKDPSTGYTGTFVYGYNLNGDYTNNMPRYHLTSGAFDFRDTTTVQIKFRRWLGIEAAPNDNAALEVSNDGSTWTTIWQHTGSAVNEASWSQQSYSLGAVAENQPTVYVRWAMGPTDAGVTYPGWNLDDVELWGIAKPIIPGDLDCDGEVGFGDINPFVLALTDFAGWQALFPDCPARNADINGDGSTDFGDINPFVALLTQ